MTTVSFVSSASQDNLQQFMLQQARRSADQAEQTAQSLKAQSDAAQRAADQSQENANSLTTQSDQAQATADQARLGLMALANSQSPFTGKFINTTA